MGTLHSRTTIKYSEFLGYRRVDRYYRKRQFGSRRENEWLKAWIKNNAALRASGDADAIAVYEEYNGSAMTAFPQLSDKNIDTNYLDNNSRAEGTENNKDKKHHLNT